MTKIRKLAEPKYRGINFPKTMMVRGERYRFSYEHNLSAQVNSVAKLHRAGSFRKDGKKMKAVVVKSTSLNSSSRKVWPIAYAVYIRK